MPLINAGLQRRELGDPLRAAEKMPETSTQRKGEAPERAEKKKRGIANFKIGLAFMASFEPCAVS